MLQLFQQRNQQVRTSRVLPEEEEEEEEERGEKICKQNLALFKLKLSHSQTHKFTRSSSREDRYRKFQQVK